MKAERHAAGGRGANCERNVPGRYKAADFILAVVIAIALLMNCKPEPVAAAGATWSLTGTVPSTNAGLGQPCPIGCRDTGTADTTSDVAKLEVWRHRQSPTWVARGAVMRVSADTFTVRWPQVRTEAAWEFVLAAAVTAGQAGKPFAIAMSDTSHGWWWAVAAVDTANNRGCLSNEVWRP